MNTVKVTLSELVSVLSTITEPATINLSTTASEKLVGKRELEENSWKRVTKTVQGTYHINFTKNSELLASIPETINLKFPSWQIDMSGPLCKKDEQIYLRVMPEKTRPQYQIDGKFATAKVLEVIKNKLSPKPKVRGMHFVYRVESIRWVQVGDTKYVVK